MTKLFKLQKKAVRLLYDAPFNAHTLPLFQQLKLLNVYDINNFNIAIFMFMCSKGLLPRSMSCKFTFNYEIHSYETRNAGNFHFPKIRTNVSKNTVYFKGPVLWKNIPINIKNSTSLNIFKRMYKSHLLLLYSISK